MTDSSLLVETDAKGVALVTLNRAAKHNAFDDALITELSQSFERLASDPSIRVMVLAAKGKHFCAGADLSLSLIHI